MTKGRKQLSPQSPAPKSEGTELEPAFEIRFTPDAACEIKDLDGSIRKQLKTVLTKKLAADPEGYGLPLRGVLTNYWKHEFATHRIVYRIYQEPKTVVVCTVGPRKQGDAADVYNQLEAVAKTGRLAEQLASVLRHVLPAKPEKK